MAVLEPRATEPQPPPPLVAVSIAIFLVVAPFVILWG